MSIHNSSMKQHKGLMPSIFTASAIKDSRMMFRATPHFAYYNDRSGLTRRFLDAATEVWGNLDDCLLDTRWHMLMPGMYPCIPGWHTDDAPRDPNKWGGQPDLWTPEKGSEHLLCVVDAGTGSHTQFIQGDVRISKTILVDEWMLNEANFYKTADRLITGGPAVPAAEYITVTPGDLVEFNTHSWHRGMPATGRGFRWFARLTRGSKHKPENEIRTNSQVYLTEANYGW